MRTLRSGKEIFTQDQKVTRLNLREMKVTISFDETKIVVPCGDGDITVRDLANLAVTRYKKAIGKPNNFWVSVSNLRSCIEGGMLDPDDLVRFCFNFISLFILNI